MKNDQHCEYVATIIFAIVLLLGCLQIQLSAEPLHSSAKRASSEGHEASKVRKRCQVQVSVVDGRVSDARRVEFQVLR